MGEGQKYSSNCERISALPVKTFVGGGQVFIHGTSFVEVGIMTTPPIDKELRKWSSRQFSVLSTELCRGDNSVPFLNSSNSSPNLLIDLHLQQVLIHVSRHLSQLVPLR
jgi:hypothetical protein